MKVLNQNETILGSVLIVSTSSAKAEQNYSIRILLTILLIEKYLKPDSALVHTLSNTVGST